jgi:hypothetical protein
VVDTEPATAVLVSEPSGSGGSITSSILRYDGPLDTRKDPSPAGDGSLRRMRF